MQISNMRIFAHMQRRVNFSSKFESIKNAYFKRVYDKDTSYIFSIVTFFSLTGDGRNDSPGHCAKCCTYTVVELASMEILACIVVDKRETKLVSVKMEVDAFKRVLNFLIEENLNVVEVVEVVEVVLFLLAWPS